jgi:hypothetical protein
VLEAIRQFVKKYKANTITFSAMKELDPTTYYGPDDVVPNPESRAKLYNRLVQRYAGAMGYSATQREGNGKVTYTLKRTKQGVAEGLEQDYLSQIPNLNWKPVTRSVWNTIQDEGLDEEQDAPNHTDWIMASLTISPKDAQALQAFNDDAIEDFNRFDIHLKSRYPGLTDLIDYDNGTVTIVKTTKQGMAEADERKEDPITSTVIDFYQHVGKIHKDPIDDYVGTAKEMLGHVSDPTLKSKLVSIFRQAKENPYIQGGVVTTIGALLAGGVLSSAQRMGLNPSQTNLALQAILNTVIPTVVSRINGKSWADTVKYTLASAGIGTGIAGIMEEEL